MKKTLRIMLPLTLSLLLAAPTVSLAQSRTPSKPTKSQPTKVQPRTSTPQVKTTTPTRTTTPQVKTTTPTRTTPQVKTTTPTRTTPQVKTTTPTRTTPQVKTTTPTRPAATPQVKPTTPTRPAVTPQVQSSPSKNNPTVNGGQKNNGTRPLTPTTPLQTVNPSGKNKGNSATPGNNIKPGNNVKPGNNPTPGNNGNNGNDKGQGNSRPGFNGGGSNGQGGVTPPSGGQHPNGGGNPPSGGQRPNGGVNPPPPGGGQSHGWNPRPQGPAPYRPGMPRPHNHYMRPNYMPPRPHGGFWGAPPRNIFRPVFYVPAPPRRVYVVPTVPTIGTILGLTFGSFIDAGINMLYNSGYNVLGYANNVVYLGNVNQLGFLWPEVTVYYNDGLMSDTQFQYWSQTPGDGRYLAIYNTLCRTYGVPVESYTVDGVLTSSWWAGGNTGFVTLQYGPGLSQTGSVYYYTTLTYSDNY